MPPQRSTGGAAGGRFPDERSPPPPAPPAVARPSSKAAKIPGPADAFFVVEGEPGAESIALLDAGQLEKGCLSLRVVVRQFLGVGQQRAMPRDSLFNILGRLRALKLLLAEYNAGIDSSGGAASDGTDRHWHGMYVRRRTLDQLSAFGFQTDNPATRLFVPGLDELLALGESLYAEELAAARELIASGKVVFEALAELYRPGEAVCGVTSLGGTLASFRVAESYFDVKRTLMGFEKVFHVVLEFVASMGEHFAVVRFEEVMSGWLGVRARPISEMSYAPLSAADAAYFERRGEAYAKYGAAGASFLRHSAGSFFPHSTSASKAGGGGALLGSARTNASGRIMVDTARGIQLGHHASQGLDEPTNAMIQMAGRYRRWANDQRQRSSGATPESLFVLPMLTQPLVKFAWPALVGFSFSVKAWGHVLVDGLGPIEFNKDAFDQLVLPSANKRLIRALVTFGAEQFDDIIAGKSGGSIFLLHGPPGVGKTLTAEAIAEQLQRPLYYVTMGELGTTPDEMERRLSDVLDLCAEWNALTLIDEADVFLETRSSADVVRNAMVCVMLRLLEYHRGILFLTTNRIREFDPAFESRVTVALRYTHLDPPAREQVWRNLVGKVGIAIGDVDFAKLAAHEMNGRQIKNAVRLALALARDAGTPLMQEWLDQSISITAAARVEMKNAQNF
ncbi:hypothetical protein HK105_201153 [Polyrhizophydium stewartii]|uniref:AAA+ ATPase domain-containing protein n=1 Tax=Polyrhizophydium stewartii TaxID=2732419 RepID=A0ABR4NIZ2_9FUNG